MSEVWRKYIDKIVEAYNVIFMPTERILRYIVSNLQYLYLDDNIFALKGFDGILSAARRCSDRGGDLFEKTVWIASCLLYYIINEHPLVDGNKRLAAVATKIFLYKNGYRTDNYALYAIIISIARGDEKLETLYHKLSRILKKKAVIEKDIAILPMSISETEISKFVIDNKDLLDRLREYDKTT